MTFLFGNRFIETGEGDEIGAVASTRFPGGFLEPVSIFEGGSPISVLEECDQTIVTECHMT